MNRITQHKLKAIQSKLNGKSRTDSEILQFAAIILAHDNSSTVSRGLTKNYYPSVAWC